MFDIKSIIGFSANFCSNCPRMYPIWAKLQEDGYEVTMIDVVDRPEIAEEYGIRSIPATVIIQDGKAIDTIIGARPYSFMLDKLKG